jgi:hypothetical protein
VAATTAHDYGIETANANGKRLGGSSMYSLPLKIYYAASYRDCPATEL